MFRLPLLHHYNTTKMYTPYIYTRINNCYVIIYNETGIYLF